MKSRFVAVIVFGLVHLPVALATSPAQPVCRPKLWPETVRSVQADNLPAAPRDILLRKVSKVLREDNKPPPVTLKSAGVTNRRDPEFLATRQAYKTTDHALQLALAYSLFSEPRYLDGAIAILLSWAETNQPTGHPIDETRLDALLWSYDLVCHRLTDDTNAAIRDYFRRLREAKRQWAFGRNSALNNHKSHQYKMLILLDKVLDNEATLSVSTQSLLDHARNNINVETGESVDYERRNALYYHVYNLEAWLEIDLVTDCCAETVKSAFEFAAEKIRKGEINSEFVNSSAPIDQRRERDGFTYAKRGGSYELSRFGRSVVVFYTAHETAPESSLWKIVEQPKLQRKLNTHILRRHLWQRP